MFSKNTMATKGKSEKFIFQRILTPKNKDTSPGYPREMFADTDIFTAPYNCYVWGLKWTISYSYDGNREKLIGNTTNEYIDNVGPIMTSWMLGFPKYMSIEDWFTVDGFDGDGHMYGSKEIIISNAMCLPTSVKNAAEQDYINMTNGSIIGTNKGTLAGPVELAIALGEQTGAVTGETLQNAQSTIDTRLNLGHIRSVALKNYSQYKASTTQTNLYGNGNERWECHVEQGKSEARRYMEKDDILSIGFHNYAYEGIILVRIQFFVSQAK